MGKFTIDGPFSDIFRSYVGHYKRVVLPLFLGSSLATGARVPQRCGPAKGFGVAYEDGQALLWR